MVPNTQLASISVVRLNSIRTEFEKKMKRFTKLRSQGKKKENASLQ